MRYYGQVNNDHLSILGILQMIVAKGRGEGGGGGGRLEMVLLLLTLQVRS